MRIAKYLWGVITSMRTALILLFCLAVAAIPGSILPQRDRDPAAVAEYVRQNPGLAKFWEAVGGFEVYTSVWFTAIYLLLLVSLVGCIIPRIGVYVRALRAPLAGPPKRMDRLPGYHTGTVPDADAAVDTAHEWLRKRRYRVRRTEYGVTAERGYLREAGNITFHLALLLSLLGIAWSALYGSTGTVVLTTGNTFANTASQYDTFSAGPAVRTDRLPPFSVLLQRFRVEFDTAKENRGNPKFFEADVTVTDGSNSRDQTISVNHPINVAGHQVTLLGHGYAPQVTVVDADGKIAFAGPAIFLPRDRVFTSSGVIKAPDARPDRLAFRGVFLPTATTRAKVPQSVFPDALNPELIITGWAGPPRKETGIPESVYTLDTDGMTQLKTADGPWQARLRPGESIKLPDGKGSIVFDGWQRWTKLQVSRDPGVGLIIAGVALLIIGVVASLFITPRRIWVRTGPDGIEIGGMNRITGRSGPEAEVAALAHECGLIASEANEGDQSG